MKTPSERKRRGIYRSTVNLGGGEVKKRVEEEDEDSICYSVKGGSKDKRKRRGRHCSTLHVGGVEVKKKVGGGKEEEGSSYYSVTRGSKKDSKRINC